MLDPKRPDLQSRDGNPLLENRQTALLPPTSATKTPVAGASTVEALPRIGVRGYLRMARVIATFLLFMLRLFINTRGWRKKRIPETDLRRQEGVLLREKLLRLGPTFIKNGQSLATRADLLPVEYIQELAKLQDEVPPFPTEQARTNIETELRGKIEDIFDEFETQPIAAASLGQVHRAKLRTGQVVAIKVQRPGIHQHVGFDIS